MLCDAWLQAAPVEESVFCASAETRNRLVVVFIHQNVRYCRAVVVAAVEPAHQGVARPKAECL